MGAGVLDALSKITERFRGHPSEQLLIFLFDEWGLCLTEMRVTNGSVCAVYAKFRPIISAALGIGARQLLLAHNHPSGCTEPSSADIRFTQDLVRICNPLEIKVLDHLIVSGVQVASMRGQICCE